MIQLFFLSLQYLQTTKNGNYKISQKIDSNLTKDFFSMIKLTESISSYKRKIKTSKLYLVILSVFIAVFKTTEMNNQLVYSNRV